MAFVLLCKLSILSTVEISNSIAILLWGRFAKRPYKIRDFVDCGCGSAALCSALDLIYMKLDYIRGGAIVFVQYCQCAGVNNFETLKKIVVSNGPFRKTVLYCCKDCYEKFFEGAK